MSSFSWYIPLMFCLWLQLFLNLPNLSNVFCKWLEWDQQNFIFIFLLKLCLLFCFICLLKILNQKATVSKETIGFDVWMATILSHIKPSFTKKYHNRLSNSTTLFVVYKWPLRIETVVIKLNEIKVFEVLFSKFYGLLRKT